jgi:hypothetical protein
MPSKSTEKCTIPFSSGSTCVPSSCTITCRPLPGLYIGFGPVSRFFSRLHFHSKPDTDRKYISNRSKMLTDLTIIAADILMKPER